HRTDSFPQCCGMNKSTFPHACSETHHVRRFCDYSVHNRGPVQDSEVHGLFEAISQALDNGSPKIGKSFNSTGVLWAEGHSKVVGGGGCVPLNVLPGFEGRKVAEGGA